MERRRVVGVQLGHDLEREDLLGLEQEVHGPAHDGERGDLRKTRRIGKFLRSLLQGDCYSCYQLQRQWGSFLGQNSTPCSFRSFMRCFEKHLLMLRELRCLFTFSLHKLLFWNLLKTSPNDLNEWSVYTLPTSPGEL